MAQIAVFAHGINLWKPILARFSGERRVIDNKCNHLIKTYFCLKILYLPVSFQEKNYHGEINPGGFERWGKTKKTCDVCLCSPGLINENPNWIFKK